MLVTSIISLIEASVAKDQQTSGTIRNNIGGEVGDPARLFSRESLRALEAEYPGVISLIAFHPVHDKAVFDYIVSGVIQRDSGDNVLVLFTLGTSATRPRIVTSGLLAGWVDIPAEDHPSYQLVRDLFPLTLPRLPGVVFLRRLSDPTEPVYVSLAHAADAAACAALLVDCYRRATEAYNVTREDVDRFATQFCQYLALGGVAYDRSGPMSELEWLYRAYHFVKQHAGDIVAIVGAIRGGGKKKAENKS
jgi:hypothetical protein